MTSHAHRRSVGARLWDLVSEPRTITIIMCAIYLTFIGQGIANVVDPAVDHVDHIPRIIANSLLFIGGSLGLISTPRGLWLFEKPALLAVSVASTIHLWWNVADLDGDGVVEPQKAARIIIVLLFLTTRWVRISGAKLDPAKP